MEDHDARPCPDLAGIRRAVKAYPRELRWLLHGGAAMLVTADPSKVPGCGEAENGEPHLHLQVDPGADPAAARAAVGAILGPLGWRESVCETPDPPDGMDEEAWDAMARRARARECGFKHAARPRAAVYVGLAPGFSIAKGLSRRVRIEGLALDVLPFQDLWEAKHRTLQALAGYPAPARDGGEAAAFEEPAGDDVPDGD